MLIADRNNPSGVLLNTMPFKKFSCYVSYLETIGLSIRIMSQRDVIIVLSRNLNDFTGKEQKPYSDCDSDIGPTTTSYTG